MKFKFEKENENVSEEVIKVVKEKMGVTVTREMIDCCHRLGKREGKCRPVIVKFCNRHLRNKIYDNKRKLKGSKLSIREDLTRLRVQLLHHVQYKLKIKESWTANGIVMFKIKNKIYKITKFSDLDKIQL